MPFVGVDPWRWQYFERHPCPADVVLPVDDVAAWNLYPGLRWFHNKLVICRSQGLPHGPHGTMPSEFPIFSKPVYYLRGMGTGSRMIATNDEYRASLEPGHMWMPVLGGPHVSTDLALVDGRIGWSRHATGVPLERGTFDYWTVHAEARPGLDAYLAEWVGRHLERFTGIVNIETIGGRIIECHLRMADQWLDLNGPGWLDAVIDLYRHGAWRYRDECRTGYSVVLFGVPGPGARVDRAIVADLRRMDGVSSIQITFDESMPLATHAMPPGGPRLAIVNCWDLAIGRRVRARLASLLAASMTNAGADSFPGCNPRLPAGVA